MTAAVLGLGGNLGDPRAAMRQALGLLDTGATQVVRVSRLYRTPPWGPIAQPDFLNCCALVETDLMPGDLLDRCLSIEVQLLRERRERWGPRRIDIDLIDMDGPRPDRPDLVLPHPRASERAFVLVPLAEILPDRPLAGRRPSEWMRTLDASQIRAESADGEWWRAMPAQSSAV